MSAVNCCLIFVEGSTDKTVRRLSSNFVPRLLAG
jgi:hypothetical protein